VDEKKDARHRWRGPGVLLLLMRVFYQSVRGMSITVCSHAATSRSSGAALAQLRLELRQNMILRPIRGFLDDWRSD
jgi:hypothetical protein